jgi:homopolymeric O-antigen transport system permease protein
MLYSELQNLFRKKYLLYALVKRDLLIRYKGSIFGVIWSIIEPIVLLILYTILFGGLFGLRLRETPSLSAYALYVFCGIVVWLAISEGLNHCTIVILENTSLVKKVIFPAEILPLKIICAAVVHQLIGLAVLLLGMLILGKSIALTWLLIPMLLIPQMLLTAGIGWLLAGITVFIRDLRQIVALGTLCLMFLTPIFYPEDIFRTAAGGKFAFWLTVNPIAALIHNYRLILLQGELPDWAMYFYVLILGVVLSVIGLWWFNKTKRAFVDVI